MWILNFPISQYFSKSFIIIRFCYYWISHWLSVSKFKVKVNNRNTRKRYEIYSKLTIKTPEQRHLRHSGVFIVQLWVYFKPFSNASIVNFAAFRYDRQLSFSCNFFEIEIGKFLLKLVKFVKMHAQVNI